MVPFSVMMREVYDAIRSKGVVIQELEDTMRAKGNVTQVEDIALGVSRRLPTVVSFLATTVSVPAFWFSLGNKLIPGPPTPRLMRIVLSAGCAFLVGNITYKLALNTCAVSIFEVRDEHMKAELTRLKLELANIILTEHSDEKSLVEAVKKHFFAEHLFSDHLQDKSLLSWHERHSYVDSTFVERVKEIEAKYSNDEAESVSGQTTLNIRSFGDLMEDPLACILGSPDSNIESNKPTERGVTTVLRRSDLRARRRSHRHHHRHAEKVAAL